jgi:hypothetical protein
MAEPVNLPYGYTLSADPLCWVLTYGNRDMYFGSLAAALDAYTEGAIRTETHARKLAGVVELAALVREVKITLSGLVLNDPHDRPVGPRKAPLGEKTPKAGIPDTEAADAP